jgi:hypothetical protein
MSHGTEFFATAAPLNSCEKKEASRVERHSLSEGWPTSTLIDLSLLISS